MNKFKKLFHVPLLILWCLTCMSSSQETGGIPDGVIPVENLSRDNPNHKRIYEWLDNYRQKVTEMSYQNTDQSQSSKQDLVNPQSYSSINDAIKLASNQPQQAIDERALPKNFEDIMRIVPQQESERKDLNKRALGDFIPAAFNQGSGQNQQVNQNIQNTQYQQAAPIQQGNQNEQAGQYQPNVQYQQQGQNEKPAPAQIILSEADLRAIYGRSQEDRMSRIEKLDPFIQDHIRKLAEQSLNDGRDVLVEVKGDDTSDDRSILEQLRPMLHDPSVLDDLKPRLQESRNMLKNQNNPIQYEPYVVEHKKPELQLDRPLLEQKDRLEKLRNLLIQQQNSNAPQNPWGQVPPQTHTTPNQIPDQNPPQIVYLDPNLINLGQNPNQRSLIQQLEALAVRPLTNQYQSPSPAQTLPPPPQNALLIPQSPNNLGAPNKVQLQTVSQNSEPTLIGQKLRQTPSQQPSLHQQYHTGNWQKDQTSAVEDQDKRQLSKRQQDQYDNGQYNEQPSISPEEESARRRLLRGQLIRDFEEQERKRSELIEIDQAHRRMIEEERRKQEVRDQQDAERRALEKQQQLTRQQKKKDNENRQSNLERQPSPQQTPPKVNSRPASIVSDQRWDSKGWTQIQHKAQPQPQTQPQQQTQAQPLPRPQAQRQPRPEQPTQEIRSHLVDGNRAGPNGPIEVLHSIQSPPPPPPPQSQALPIQITNGQLEPSDWRINVETALNQLQRSEKQSLNQQTRGPIQVSAAALERAEQSDAEYIKLLREILMSQLEQTQPQPNERTSNQRIAFVPVEAPPTGGQLTTTLPSGQVIDGNDTNWWRNDKSQRLRAEPNTQ